MSQLFADPQSTATISDDGRYRYDLGRQWGLGDLALWIMLNPSTADAHKDDPTIRRVRAFTQREALAGFVVVNLYALRSSTPHALCQDGDSVGPDDDATIGQWLAAPGIRAVIAAWGANTLDGIDRRVAKIHDLARRERRELLCLGTTKTGAPRHPLYVRGDQELEHLQEAV